MHFLQKKIQLLSQLARTIEQFPELAAGGSSAGPILLTDIAALRKHRRFLRKPRRIDSRPAPAILSTWRRAGVRTPAVASRRARRTCSTWPPIRRQTIAQLLHQMTPFRPPHIIQLCQCLPQAAIQQASKPLCSSSVSARLW